MSVICARCHEVIDPSEQLYLGESLVLGEPPPGVPFFHWECQARMVIGSVGHLLRLCSCYGGTVDDPDFLTRRQSAKLAVAVNREMHSWFPREEIPST